MKILFMFILIISFSGLANSQSIDNHPAWVGKHIFDDNREEDRGDGLMFSPPLFYTSSDSSTVSASALTVYYRRKSIEIIQGRQVEVVRIVAATPDEIHSVNAKMFNQPTFVDGTGKRWYYNPIPINWNRWKESPDSAPLEYILGK